MLNVNVICTDRTRANDYHYVTYSELGYTRLV